VKSLHDAIREVKALRRRMKAFVGREVDIDPRTDADGWLALGARFSRAKTTLRGLEAVANAKQRERLRRQHERASVAETEREAAWERYRAKRSCADGTTTDSDITITY
jgi:hypothetical protein